jgi:hypothetical protein
MNFFVKLIGIFVIMVVVMNILALFMPDIINMNGQGYIFCGAVSLFFAVVEGD